MAQEEAGEQAGASGSGSRSNDPSPLKPLPFLVACASAFPPPRPPVPGLFVDEREGHEEQEEEEGPVAPPRGGMYMVRGGAVVGWALSRVYRV